MQLNHLCGVDTLSECPDIPYTCFRDEHIITTDGIMLCDVHVPGFPLSGYMKNVDMVELKGLLTHTDRPAEYIVDDNNVYFTSATRYHTLTLSPIPIYSDVKAFDKVLAKLDAYKNRQPVRTHSVRLDPYMLNRVGTIIEEFYHNVSMFTQNTLLEFYGVESPIAFETKHHLGTLTIYLAPLKHKLDASDVQM